VALAKVRNQHERDLEKTCVAWFKQTYAINVALIAKSLNGEYMTKGQRVNAINSGMLVGDTDLTIYTRKASTIKIELKAPTPKKISSKTGKIINGKGGGTLEPSQKIIHKELLSFGFLVFVVDNLTDFKQICKMTIF
tara:strand:- start:477 stop:887 length:411 start_codon:yes stop_codon:yes gene_type:complete